MKRYKKRKKKEFLRKGIFIFSLITLIFSAVILNKEDALSVSYEGKDGFYEKGEIEMPEKETKDDENSFLSDDEEKEIPPLLNFDIEEESADFPDVPEEMRRNVIEADLSYKDSNIFLHTHGISLKNATQYSDEEISSLLDTPMKMRFKETEKPQFLIYHTHATESFNPCDREYYDKRYNWRSRDNTINMVSVGNAALNELKEAGLPFIHDTSQHDYPSYNGSYKNSFDSVSDILKGNSEIKVCLDLHRDAIQKESGDITKPVLVLPDGTKIAQIMIIANCDDGSGLIPCWRENFRFAKELYLSLQKICPGIARPILLSHRKYNQQLSTGSLLIEVGGHANTLKEAKRAGKVLGLALKDIYENFKE